MYSFPRPTGISQRYNRRRTAHHPGPKFAAMGRDFREVNLKNRYRFRQTGHELP